MTEAAKVAVTFIANEGYFAADTSSRAEILHDLYWAAELVDLESLTTPQLRTIRDHVQRQLIEAGKCSLTVSGFVRQERRLGRTHRFGWRWVVYVGLPASEEEVAVCTTRRYGRLSMRRHMALWWHDDIRRKETATT